MEVSTRDYLVIWEGTAVRPLSSKAGCTGSAISVYYIPDPAHSDYGQASWTPRDQLRFIRWVLPVLVMLMWEPQTSLLNITELRRITCCSLEPNVSAIVRLQMGQGVGKPAEIFSQTENIGNKCLWIYFIWNCWQLHILILLSAAKEFPLNPL